MITTIPGHGPRPSGLQARGLLTRTAATIAAHTLMRACLAGMDQPT